MSNDRFKDVRVKYRARARDSWVNNYGNYGYS